MPPFWAASAPAIVGEIAPAGDGLEFLRIERIHRQVEPAHAGRGEFAGVISELRSVCGQRQFGQRAGFEMARKRAEKADDVRAAPAARRR